MQSKQQHWDTLYTTRMEKELGWKQQVPRMSLDFIHGFNLPKSASIIDVGGGDSKLVDHLLEVKQNFVFCSFKKI